MNWSLGETGALALKAARGAGMTWGLAEEASEVVVWLHAHGCPGVAAFCSYLSWYETQKFLVPEWTGLTGDTPPLCPLATGAAISDGVLRLPHGSDKHLPLGVVKQPVLLLPFVSRNTSNVFGLYAGNTLISLRLLQKKTRAYGEFCNSLLIGEADCFVRAIAKVSEPKIIQENRPFRLPDYYEGCIDVLTKYAKKTYAPSTYHSRTTGAGANISDSD